MALVKWQDSRGDLRGNRVTECLLLEATGKRRGAGSFQGEERQHLEGAKREQGCRGPQGLKEVAGLQAAPRGR